MSAKRILVVDDDKLNLKMVSNLLETQEYQVLTTLSGREALYLTEREAVDLILLDVMMPEMDGFETCQRLRAQAATANVPIILLTALENLEHKIRGFESGADDYIPKPFDPPELLVRVSALLRRAERTLPSAASLDGRVIACFSLRGGVGVSGIATNLAVSLAQIWRNRVALIDLNLLAGQSALLLNLPARQTWSDLSVNDAAELDQEMVEMVMRSHESGVRVLAAPARPEESEAISLEVLRHTLDIVRRRYDYVIIDLPHDFSDGALAGLDAADLILLIFAPELASVRAASLSIDTFENLGYEAEKIALVLNWIFERRGLAQDQIEAALKRPIDLVLPYVPETFVHAINAGSPPAFEDPESVVGTLFEDVAFLLSKEEHRKTRPEQPSPAWERAEARARKRQKK